MRGRIRLSSSPYTFVRTIVMEAALFRSSDYAKLLKMDLPEIIQFLEETTYRREIDELAVSEQGVQLIEHSVQRNFRHAVEKLRRISEPELRYLIDAYLWRNDIMNVETLVRAKRSSEKPERVQNLFIPGTIPKDELMRLYRLESVEALLEHLDMPFAQGIFTVYRDHGIPGFEAELTKRYYETTLAIAERIKGGGDIFRDFLQLEVSITNIMTVLKLKQEGASAEQIGQYLIRERSDGLRQASRARLLQKLVEAASVEECFPILSSSWLRHALEDAASNYSRTGSLLDTERDLQRFLLRRTTLLTHQHPLSVDVVLGYLFEKVNEKRNIFIIVKGKQLGMPEAFIEQELIIR